MSQIEVEHRGRLTAQEFKKIKSFFDKKGKFLGLNKRFSVIYSQAKNDKSKKLCKSPVDLRIRVTNKKGELALKYGKWSGNDARKEFLFPVEPKKIDEMVSFLEILGYYHGVLQATHTYRYLYKNIEFALVDVPGWGYYFEAEIITDQKLVEKANYKIKEECQKLDIKILDYKGFCELLNDLNNRPGYRFNFKKKPFSLIKKNFIDYF
jgi:adenylate cyclase class IV